MSAPKPNQPAPVARGRALQRTDLERDRLSMVSHADVLAAMDLWHQTAPAEFRGLLDARQEREKP